jgi:hypothetical protein
MKLAADDVQPLVIPDCGHWVAAQAPDELLASLTAFLNPYRDGPTAGPSPRQEVPDTSRQRTGTPHQRSTHPCMRTGSRYPRVHRQPAAERREAFRSLR